MGQTIRCSLPGYDAATDTNLDHYSLYADVDNVLIKELTSGSITVGTAGQNASGESISTIPHNLGYIPFFLAYTNYGGAGGTTWNILNNQYNLFEAPLAISSADTTNLYLYNFLGTSTPMPMQYRIFYDAMSSGTSSFTQSTEGIKVTRPGVDGTSTNPNDYIMHSDLNNFKIIQSGTYAADFPAGSIIPFAHNAPITDPVQYLAFFSAGSTSPILTGAAPSVAQSGTYKVYSSADGTNLYVKAYNFTGTIHGTVAYYLFGAGKDTTFTHGERLVVSIPGVDAGTATNPDLFNFHSDYPTLKYYANGTFTMNNVTSTTYGTLAHNLGYTPFFIGFVNDVEGIIPGGYAIVPYYLGKSSIAVGTADVGAFMYADSTNLYFKAWFDTNATGTYSFTFYYKLFKNNLGL